MRKLRVIDTDGIRQKPFQTRKYVLCHSDDRAELFLYIGSSWEIGGKSGKMDEVFGEWEETNGRLALHLTCFLDCSTSRFGTEKRYNLFVRHMPNVVLAIALGDKLEQSGLMDSPVFFHFISRDLHYNRVAGGQTLRAVLLNQDSFAKIDILE